MDTKDKSIFNKCIEVYKYEKMSIHCFKSPEAMADISFIIEGTDELVILEQQSFYKSIEVFKEYVESLKKPVIKVVADYHTEGLAEWDPKLVVMIEGMPEFEKGSVYNGMMKSFEKEFKGAMNTSTHEPTDTIAVKNTQNWARIKFYFFPGPGIDFPGASIIIGERVYYSHFAPAFAHVSAMQISSLSAIDILHKELCKMRDSKCKLFIGSHGNAADIDAVKFEIIYLEKMKEWHEIAKTNSKFVELMTNSFSGIPEVDNLHEVANILYK